MTRLGKVELSTAGRSVFPRDWKIAAESPDSISLLGARTTCIRYIRREKEKFNDNVFHLIVESIVRNFIEILALTSASIMNMIRDDDHGIDYTRFY